MLTLTGVSNEEVNQLIDTTIRRLVDNDYLATPYWIAYTIDNNLYRMTHDDECNAILVYWTHEMSINRVALMELIENNPEIPTRYFHFA